MSKEYDRTCPLARASIVLEGRWTILVMRELFRHGPRRFQDFVDAFSHISPTTLSDRLKRLSDQGIIVQEYYETNPIRAHYVLTPRGEALRPIIRALKEWGAQHSAP